MPERSVKAAIRQRLIEQDKRLHAELQAVAEEYADIGVQKRQAVVRDWTHRPKFDGVTEVQKQRIVSNVIVKGRNAKLWQWVDEGTKPHDIRPKKKGGLLRFRVGYDARTAPIAKFNVGTGRAYGVWVSKRVVHHPGTKARKFSQKFNEDILPEFRKAVEAAIRRALRRGRK